MDPAHLTAELRDGERILKSFTQTLAGTTAISTTWFSRISPPSTFGICDIRDCIAWWCELQATSSPTNIPSGSAFATPASPKKVSSQRPAHQVARPEPSPDVSLYGRRHARASAAPRRHRAAQRPGMQSSCARRTIRNRRIFWMPATKWACWSSKRFQAGSIIGDAAWQDLAVKNVEDMIRRDWNHPSIVLWGVRINESADNHDFYTRTNALAHKLDPSRQTGGIRNHYDSELLEDVFTMNDFGFPLRPPNHPRYLNTEFNGHMYSTKRIDNVEHVAEHVHPPCPRAQSTGGRRPLRRRHRLVRLRLRVARLFRLRRSHLLSRRGRYFPRPESGGLCLQVAVDPVEEVVLEPGFDWSWGDKPQGNGPGLVPILSNCDHLKLFYNGAPYAEIDPDRQTFPNLPHPPFMADLTHNRFDRWGELKIEGYIGGKLAITRVLSGRGVDAELHVEPG